MMQLGISGGSGLIGRALCRRLGEEGHELTVFGRTPVGNLNFVQWDALAGPPPPSSLGGLDGFVHLAGEPIAARQWTVRQKQLIRDSRTKGTRHLVEEIQREAGALKVLVSASATGYYGARDGEILTEESPPGEGYLAEVCTAWEQEALRAENFGVRVAMVRTGLVLSRKGGALPRMLTPFRFGLGGKLGRGGQYMSWIHLEDQVRLLLAMLQDDRYQGPFNATAPNPVTNEEFTRILARVLHRPAFFKVPAPALRLLLGEMAEALLLEGQRVVPARAQGLGFSFRFPDLRQALENLLAS